MQSYSQDSWYLLFDTPLTKGKVNLFIQPLSSQATINSQLFKQKKGYRTPLFQLMLPNEQAFRVYLNVSTQKDILRLPIKLISEDELLSTSKFNYIFYASVIAGLFVLGIYNLLLFFRLKEPSYLSIALFTLAVQLILYRDSNLFENLSFLNSANNYFFSTPELISIFSTLNYWRHINNMTDPLLDRFLKIILWGCLLLIPIMGLIPNETKWLYSFASIFIFIVFIWMSKVALSGHRFTQSFYIGVTLFFLTTTPYLFIHAGIITQYFENITFLAHAGILSAVILLSISQAEFTLFFKSQAEKATAESNAKDKLLTTMSHELRTPMHAVVGASELLKRTPLSAEQKSYVGTLETASSHMLNTIDDILDFSRIEAQYVQLNKQPFQLNNIIEKIQHLFAFTAEKKGLEFSIQYSKPINQYLLGDSTRLTQILINLLGNAVKYTENGQVTLSIVGLEADNKQQARLLFKVSDTGIGITPQQQQQLFVPFYQVEDGVSRQYTGSGLGLSISHQLVELMEGKLEVKSTLNKGSHFFFTLNLPIQNKKSIHSVSIDNTIKNKLKILKSTKILLVDDDQLNLFIGKSSLEKLGIHVVLANSGKKAIRRLKEDSFDLVFMDVSMPKMDGYETTQKIRRNPKYKDLPIIALTAHTMTDERERCLTAGMNDYLTKPFKIADLQKTIENNLLVSVKQ